MQGEINESIYTYKERPPDRRIRSFLGQVPEPLGHGALSSRRSLRLIHLGFPFSITLRFQTELNVPAAEKSQTSPRNRELFGREHRIDWWVSWSERTGRFVKAMASGPKLSCKAGFDSNYRRASEREARMGNSGDRRRHSSGVYSGSAIVKLSANCSAWRREKR